MTDPKTSDGRYMVVRGRLWRLSNPALKPKDRESWVSKLMAARREIRLAAGDSARIRKARATVQRCKVALGERGPVWWRDGAPDYNRFMAVNTPYAEWFHSLEGDDGAKRAAPSSRAKRAPTRPTAKRSKKSVRRARAQRLKLATFNINGINQRLESLLHWLSTSAPDVVCLQELKADNNRFPLEAIRDAGYGAIWQGQPSWNGVAILAKGVDPIETRRGLPGDAHDSQSRYIEAAVNGILVGCLYLPNGNPQPGPKFAYKLAWFERLIEYAAQLISTQHPVALCGDFNVVPTDFDIYDTKSWKKNALLQPQSRAAFSRLLDQGWTDSLRQHFPDERVYTFWDYFRNHWQRDAGLRIDHLLLSPALRKRLSAAGVDRYVRDGEHPSDHAPAWIELK